MVTKNNCLTLFLLILFTHLSSGQNITKLDKTKISAANLDSKINSLMEAAHIQGLAVTVFNNNKPVYKKTFGYKNGLTKEPINKETNFYGASLSKSVFAVMVMQLVEKAFLI